MTQKTMAIIKIRELIGSSEKSFEDALKNIVEHEVKKGKNITGRKLSPKACRWKMEKSKNIRST